MAAISGKGGTVLKSSTPIAEVMTWKISHKSINSAWASSSTSGYKKRVGGTKDWGGSMTLKRDTAAVIPLEPGTIYTLHLTEDGTKEYSGPAIIDSVDEIVDIDNGEAIGLEVTFSGAGVLTPPA